MYASVFHLQNGRTLLPKSTIPNAHKPKAKFHLKEFCSFFPETHKFRTGSIENEGLRTDDGGSKTGRRSASVCAWFKDAATWQAWFAFIAALFALPMSAEQLAVYREHNHGVTTANFIVDLIVRTWTSTIPDCTGMRSVTVSTNFRL